MTRGGWGLAALVAIAATAGCTREGAPPTPPLRFAIMGHLDSETIHGEALALHAHLEEVLGRPVSVQVLGDYAQAQGHIAGAEADFAILSPLAYVLVKEAVPEIELLARVVAAGSPSYDGALVAKAGAGLDTVAQLKGKRVCWVSTSSTSGYLYPRIFLRAQGLDPERLFSRAELTGSHVASLRGVVNGTCDVAATYTAALDNATAVGLHREDFVILSRTGEMPLDPVVSRPGLDPEIRDQVRAALLAIDPATENRLANVRSFLRWEGFIAAADRDYDVIRRALQKDRGADAEIDTPDPPGAATGTEGGPPAAPGDTPDGTPVGRPR